MAGKPRSVKRYVMRLEPDERERLAAMLRKGTQRAQALTKARILLKADVSEAGEGCSDSRIIEALGTNPSTVHRKHGSWLDLAESELGVLAAQCLDRRIPDKQMMVDQVGAWTRERNAAKAGADWRFTTSDARIKLKTLYPSA